MKKFCKLCGKEKSIKVEGKLFNEETGEKNYHMECPDENSKDCIHHHDFNFVEGYFSGTYIQCKKCNKREDYYYW